MKNGKRTTTTAERQKIGQKVNVPSVIKKKARAYKKTLTFVGPTSLLLLLLNLHFSWGILNWYSWCKIVLLILGAV